MPVLCIKFSTSIDLPERVQEMNFKYKIIENFKCTDGEKKIKYLDKLVKIINANSKRSST